MSRNNDYTTGTLLNHFFIKNIILIDVDLSKQTTNMDISQKINFVGKLEENDRAALFIIAEKLQKYILNFSLDSLIITE